MSRREVTERDFRIPEYYDAKPEDYEFRDDGKVVRKDRWEWGIRAIAGILQEHGLGLNRSDFEIDNIVDVVRKLAKLVKPDEPEEEEEEAN